MTIGELVVGAGVLILVVMGILYAGWYIGFKKGYDQGEKEERNSVAKTPIHLIDYAGKALDQGSIYPFVFGRLQGEAHSSLLTVAADKNLLFWL